MREISTYISKYHFFPSYRLFNDDGDFHRKHMADENFTIYFVVKTKKLVWNPENCNISNNFTISAELLHGEVPVYGRVDMESFWYEMAVSKQNFPSKREMSSYAMSRAQIPGVVGDGQKYQAMSSIVSSERNTKIIVDCGIKKCMTRDHDGTTDLYSYQMAHMFDWNLHHPLEIVYIGKSDKDAFSRLENHEKWGRIYASKNDDEDILVYFMKVESQEFDISNSSDTTYIRRSQNVISLEEATCVTEMALINHFKPEFNRYHTERDIRQTEAVGSLASQGFNRFVVELILDGGPMSCIETSYAGKNPQQAHFVLS